MTQPQPTESASLPLDQAQAWLHERLTRDLVYNKVLILERSGPINREILEQTLNEIIRRHRILPTSLQGKNGTPVQLVVPQPVKLQSTEMTFLPSKQQRDEILRIATDEAQRPFDLAEGPLLRGSLLRLSQEDEEYVLLVTLPSILTDEWSQNIIACEIGVLYQAYSTGEPSPLPDLAMHYSDYADSHRSAFQNDVLDQEVSYWRERLTGIPPVMEFPGDGHRAIQPGLRRSRQTIHLSKELSESLEELSGREEVTLFTVLLAAFQVLLSRYTTQSDVVIGCIVPGREELETQHLVGLFARTVVVRNDLANDPTVRQLLKRVSDAAQRDKKHQRLPFDHVFSKIDLKRNTPGDPLFRILFSLSPPASLPTKGWRISDVEVDAGPPSFDLHLNLCNGENGVVACFEYNPELYELATIIRIAGQFEELLKGVVTSPDETISKLPFLTEAERHEILYEWNNTHAEYPNDRCVHHLFEEQANQTPDAVAVIFENCELTYRELNARANQLANYLLGVGVRPEMLVGICVDRSVELVVGLLAILKAGGAYLPIDSRYPASRISFMLDDSEVGVLVTEERLRAKVSEFKGRVVCLDSRYICNEKDENCAGGASAENLAYVIYTSGSTGKPKGVAIPHRAVVNFLWSMRLKPGVTAKDTVLAITTTSFDIAVLELYLPLIVGARVALASREVAIDGSRLQEMMERTATTVLQATPATWRILLDAGWQGTPNLKILCGGEAFPPDLVNKLLTRGSEVWNMYGPTETTVWSTVSRIDCSNLPVTIGRPIANTCAYVLDGNLQPVPVGVAAELYIGGDGVARGYLHRPDLTNEKFIASPFRRGARLYRTGDLARYRANGEIDCLGRIDNQVKVRGFRIELGEIESVIRDYSGVRQCVVVSREDVPGDMRLIAYVVVDHQYSPLDELRGFLKTKLPDYMLPSRFVFLKELPLTPSGKVDRRALPKPEDSESVQQENALPKNDIQARLVKIWSSVLNLRTVHIRDNFFELGGHSLLVAKLIRRIDQAFGRQFSMAAVFEAPTIEQQAELICKDKKNVSLLSGIVSINAAGSSPAFFCFGLDCGPVYIPLARRLGADQPFFCVGLTEAEARQLPIPFRLEDIVALLIKQVRERQPEGPYYLGGFCSGGLMAYEAARLLRSQGHKVAQVALIEPQIPFEPSRNLTATTRFRLWAQKLRFHLSNLQRLNSRDLWGYVHDRLFRALFLNLTGLHLFARRTDDSARSPAEILYLASRRYQPLTLSGPVMLFQATNRLPGSDWEREYWAELSPALEVHKIPGYSNWVVHSFAEPNVSVLAEKLTNCFAKCAPRRLENSEVIYSVQNT